MKVNMRTDNTKTLAIGVRGRCGVSTSLTRGPFSVMVILANKLQIGQRWFVCYKNNNQ